VPSNGRWRRFKIVVPINTDDKERELMSGLRNALERGETLKKAMQSFVNAGYDSRVVFAAAKKINNISQPISTQISTPATKSLPTISASDLKGKSSKKLIIISVIVSVIILAGATILGIFWNRFF